MSISNLISKGLRYYFTVVILTYMLVLVAKINHFAISGIVSNLFLVTLAIFAAFIIARVMVAVKSMIS